jgi:catechol 2,3-dioxygenase
VAYYEQVIGFRTRERSATRAILGSDSDDPPILELHEHRGAQPVPRRGRIGLFHFAILLPERAALGRFVVHLARASIRAGMSDHLVSEAIYLSDPDGLGIEVYADRPRSAWRHDGGQIEMATNPLDVTALAAASNDQPWTALPAGTIIGHVHLHVGDLAGASAFYHEALGFDKVVWSYPGALFLSAGGYHHHLGTNTWAVGAPVAGPDDARLIDWEILVPLAEDATRAGRSLISAGYAAEEVDGGWSTADPWGTTLRLSASAIPAQRAK